MATHRLGLVMHGVTGRMGLNQHLKRSILAIRDAGGVALANGDRVVPEPLLLGRNDRKLRAIARATGLDAYTTDYDAAIRSAEHSLFFDAGATLMRSELIGKAIAAGKHVYCEKPVAGSLAAALEVCERAEAAGVKAGVVMDKLFLPGLIKLAQLKADGFFGRILSVQIDFGYWVFTGEGTPSNRPSWNYRTRDGGGIIFDMMAHWRYVLDRIVAPDAPFPSGSADDDRCASRANLPARRTRDTATTRGARGHPIAIGSRWGTAHPADTASRDRETAGAAELHFEFTTHELLRLFDMCEAEPLFQLTTPAACRQDLERFDAHVWDPIDRAVAALDGGRAQADRTLGAANVVVDQWVRLRALRCWLRTQRSVAAWVAGVHGFLEARAEGARTRMADCRALVRDMVRQEIANSEDLLELLTSGVEFMATTDGPETQLIHGRNLDGLLRTRIALMQAHIDDEPWIDSRYTERKAGETPG